MKVSEVLVGMDAYTEAALAPVAIDGGWRDDMRSTHMQARYMLVGALIGVVPLLMDRGESVLEFDLDADELLAWLKDRRGKEVVK